MIVSPRKLIPRISGGLGRILKFALVFPLTAFGSVSTTVTWDASPDASVTGYDVYYGTSSHDYTNVVSVGNMTSAVIGDLSENTTYFFAAKAHDDDGNESEFSNEATFGEYQVGPKHSLDLNTIPLALAGDQVIFTLATGAPATVSINPATGFLTWKPDPDENAINDITVLVTDLTNPDASTQINLVLTLSDYLNLVPASVPLQTGQVASLPLTLAASDSTTDLVLNVKWPADQLQNPWLSLAMPLDGGLLQNLGTNLVVHLWTANGDMIKGTNTIAQIHFQAAANQSSAFVPVPVSIASATKSDGSAFLNTAGEEGQVVVIGVNPLLQPQADPVQGRTLTLYSNPGNDYQLQCATSLSPPVQWQPMLDFQPTNVEQTINLDSDNPVIYYRLMQQ